MVEHAMVILPCIHFTILTFCTLNLQVQIVLFSTQNNPPENSQSV